MTDSPCRREQRDPAESTDQRAHVATPRDAGCDPDARARAAEAAGAFLDSLLSRQPR